MLNWGRSNPPARQAAALQPAQTAMAPARLTTPSDGKDTNAGSSPVQRLRRMSSAIAATALAAAAFVAASGAGSPVGQRDFVVSHAPQPVAHYPEGPQWLADGLLWAEMPRDRVVKLAQGKLEPVWQEAGCGPTSIKRIPAGGYWVLCHLGHRVLRLDAGFATVARFERTQSGEAIAWPNDASVDPAGNLYLSSSGLFALDAPAQGKLIFIALADGKPQVIASGIRYANGVLVDTPHARVLVSEHLNRRVLSFPLKAPGVIGPPGVFFDFASAPKVDKPYELSGADGLAAFANGDIGIADYGNGRLLFVSTDGRFLEQLPLEYRYVTNMAIQPDQRGLYVTMTRDNATAALDGVVREFTIQTRKQHRAQR